MATIQATKLRKGMLFKLDNDLFRALDVQHVTPGNLRGFVRIKMRNIQNGSMAEEKFRSEDIVERVSLEQKEMQFLYNDADGYHFMDTVMFDQVQLTADLLEVPAPHRLRCADQHVVDERPAVDRKSPPALEQLRDQARAVLSLAEQRGQQLDEAIVDLLRCL